MKRPVEESRHRLRLLGARFRLGFGLAVLGWLNCSGQAAPVAPADLAVTSSALDGQVTLNWAAAGGATGYVVKRAPSAGGTFADVGTPTATTFSDATVAAGTRYFYRVAAVDGTGEGVSSLTVNSFPAEVVDNADAAGVTLTGAWTASTGVAGFYGTNYLLDGDTGTGKNVRFTPTLPLAGRYDVYLRWTADANRASNVRVEVNAEPGTTFLRVNQQANGGAWVKLGAFDFPAGTTGSVRVRNDGANGWVVADAVQFVFNDQPLPGYAQATFADEFDGTAYDPAVWSVYDSRPNNFVNGGQLRLTTEWNGTDWIAGGLYTSQFMQRFGYYETTMQVARDDGLNNAFWLYTPFSHGNAADILEIDITEAHFHDHNHMNVHDWRPTHTASSATQTVADIYPGYHQVGLEWTTAGELRWFWDGVLVRTMTASALNGMENMTPMQVMFSTKVIPFAGTPGPTLDGSSMDIAYARVWMKPGWLGALSGNWGTVSNWGPDGVPGAGDAAVFNQAVTNTTVSLLSDKSVKELYFAAPQCPPMTLAAGPFKFLLGALASGTGVGGILVNGDVTTAQTINTAIEARQELSFLNYSTAPGASLNVNGALTSSAGGRNLILGGNGRVNLGGSVSSQYDSVTKVNTGTAWLTATNSHAGLTDVRDGALVVAANGALGATGTGTVVASGATLALAGGVAYTAAETVDLQGNGETGWQGALDVADDSSVSFAGLLVLNAAARIGSGSGTLTLASTLDTTAAGFALTFNGSGTTVLNGAITGAGSVAKTGTGTLRFNAPASHTGTTTVTDGTLITTLANLPGSVTNHGTHIYEQAVDATFAGNWGGSGTIIKQGAGTLTVATAQSTTGALNVQGGTVKLGLNEAFTSSLDVTVNGGTFDLNGFTETLGAVVLDGGSIVNSTGTSAQYFAGSTFELRSGTVSARLGGNGALTKTTTGSVTLSGANTFLGGTTVQDGTLELAGSLNSALTVDGGTLGLGATTGIRTVNAGVAVNAAGTLRIRLNGPALGTQYDQLSAAANVTLAGTLELTSTAGLSVGNTFTIVSKTSPGAVSGTFSGLPQNTTFPTAPNYIWQISYTGGDGNDVVVTFASLMTPIEAFRFQYFGIISNTGNAADSADPDGDGRTNLEEFNASTNPLEVTAPDVLITSPAAEPVTVAALADTLHLSAALQQSSATAPLSWAWSKLSGPGGTTFAGSNNATTTVTFETAGSYVLQATATLGSTTASATRTVLVATPATLTFRQGESGYSHAATFIRGDTPAWNSGARDQLLIGRNGNNGMRGLFAFDLPGVPANATVTSASFDLWAASTSSGTINNLQLRPLLKDFTEGSGDGSSSANGANTGADWNSRTGPSTANLWGAAGGQSGTDFSATVIGSLAGFNTASTPAGTQHGFTLDPAFVTEANAALAAARPLRFMLTMTNDTIAGSSVFARFASDDHPTAAYRPRLALGFTANPAPVIATGPAPAASSGIPATLTGSASGATGSTWSLVSGTGTASFADSNNPATTVTFSQPGSYVLRLLSSNANGEVSRTLAVEVTAPLDPADFADWQQLTWPGVTAPQIIGPAADPDADGLENLLEWALALSPVTPDSFRPLFSKRGAILEYTYTRRKTAPGEAVYQVEWSDTLAAPWTSVVSDPPASLDATRESVHTAMPAGPNGRRFVRVRVAADP